jgi:hypothetical protein
MRVGSFQVPLCACARRCERSPALRASEKEDMSKLVGYSLQGTLLSRQSD